MFFFDLFICALLFELSYFAVSLTLFPLPSVFLTGILKAVGYVPFDMSFSTAL